MDIAEFDYDLPPELIAQEPIEPRDSARLLVIDRKEQTIEDRVFNEITELLIPGDCLVVNNVRVLPARLFGEKADTKAAVEFLLLSEVADGKWEVLVKPGRKLPVGSTVSFGGGDLKATVEKRMAEGKRLVSFEYEGVFKENLNRMGKLPLPPYIHKDLADPSRYQTVYAKGGAAVAAPTAGLHFTQDLLRKISRKSVDFASISLDVGLDSFRPVRTRKIQEHEMHSERYCLEKKMVNIIDDAIDRDRRIIAAGTTSARALESAALKVSDDNRGRLTKNSSKQVGQWIVQAAQGKTDLFIYPGYQFKIVDVMLTNFHLPRSTLLMMVCAFASTKLIMEAYQHAIQHKYRFFSFGDAMLII